MLLHVFAHVDADHRVFVAEHRLAQRTAQFRFAHARRPKENEAANRPLGILQASPCTANGARHGADRLFLPDHAAVQCVLQVNQPFRLTLRHPADRDTRPAGHNLRDVVFLHGRAVLRLLLIPRLAHLLQFNTQAPFLIAQQSSLLEVLMRNRILLTLPQLLQLRLLLVQIRRRRERLNAHAGCRLVHQVDSLIRQEPVGDVPVRQLHRRLQRIIRDRQAVVFFIFFTQSAQNFERFLRAGFADIDRLKASFQRRILLNMLAVFIQRRRADALHLAAGQRRLQDVRSIQAAFRLTCADDVMNLINEQQHVPGLGNLVHHILEAFLKFAAVLASGNHAADIQRQHPLVSQHLRYAAVHNALRQALRHGALAHAGFADDHGVILRPADEDLDHPLNLRIAPDHRIQLVLTRRLGQIAAVLFQRGRILAALLLLALRLTRLLAALFTALAHQAEDFLLCLLEIDAALPQKRSRLALAVPQDRQPEMLRSHVRLTHPP